jgi:uncharacterized protein YjbI with pentapeptide repeats
VSNIDFAPSTLPAAVAGLFRLNGYTVTGPVNKYGGEVDLVAVRPGDLFPDPIYLEVTVEHVDNDKYAADLTKLASIATQEPSAKRMIISSKGFSERVLAKAEAAGISTFTFEELERRFQRFEPYIARVLEDGTEATALQQLAAVYEEPDFHDSLGHDQATGYLTRWLKDDAAQRWLIVTGEYGTGKTALTRVLLKRWLESYRLDSTLPVPFRIELRTFTRQFDAPSLLHAFLDQNGLSDLPIQFVMSLIRSGRVVLLLDGYDEMAQYMHARERRVCLEALAQLSADGARGILTSRPNYFTEAEELQVLDALYTSLEQAGTLTHDETSLIAEEREVDALFEQHFIERVERQLRDLSPSQTEALVRRQLSGSEQAEQVVVGLLRRIFRTDEEGADIALSGKPVIISYLLEIADTLTARDVPEERVTEWQVYDLVVRNLMVRDLRAAPELLPARRRAFLGRLALLLSRREYSVLSDPDFAEFVRSDFETELRAVPPEAREERLQQYVTDLRRSATLTRASVGGVSGSRFSHNSLREFLASETLLAQLESAALARRETPVSPAMRNFVASQSETERRTLIDRLAGYWPAREDHDGAGQLLSLLWNALLITHAAEQDSVRTALATIAGDALDFRAVALDDMSLDSAGAPVLRRAVFSGAALTRVAFGGCDLGEAKFDGAVLDEVDFAASQLRKASFVGAAFADVDISAADVKEANFTSPDTQFSLIDRGRRLEGAAAIGLLRARGARTDEVDQIYVVQHHPKFDVAAKVAAVVLDGGKHQVRGLTQRGSAASDPQFARKFLVQLVNDGYLTASSGRQLVQVTEEGRHHLRPFAERTHLTAELERIFTRAL